MSLHYKGIIHKAKISDILKYFRLYFGFALQKQMVLPVYRNVVSFATVQNFKSILIFDNISDPTITMILPSLKQTL